MQTDINTPAPVQEPMFTGPQAIEHALSKINLDKLRDEHMKIIQSGARSKRARSVHVLNAVEGMKKNNLTPDKLLIKNVPVIPPVFRPFSVIGNSFVPGDANELYRDLFQYRDSHNESVSVLGEAGSSQSKLDLYDTVKALYGYGDPIAPKTKQRGVAGFLHTLTGNNPKFCYDDETEILTNKGWVLFKDLPEDINVATINPNTLFFEWEKPSAYIHSIYNGELVKYSSKRVDLLVTPNHRMWLRPRRTKELLGYGADMTKNWLVESATRVVSRGSRYWVQTGAVGWKGTSNFVPEAFKKVPVALFAEWLGWWLSDGHIHGDNSSVVVSQSYANLEYCDTLDKLFTKLSSYGLTVSRRDHVYKGKMIGHNWAIIYNKELVKWCEEHCNRYCHNKRIPEDILNWSTDNLSILLKAYLKGDGEKINRRVVKNANHKFRNKFTNDHCRFITTSKELYDNLSEIACKLGMTVVQSPIRNIKSKRPVHYREQFRGSIIGRWNTVEEGRKHVSIEPYNGYVHCCSTNNGLLIVRRNGKVAVSGNSFVNRKLLSKPQDSVARGTITVNPDLSLDEIGVPLNMAWTMYAPYVQRRLVQSGMSPVSALTNIKDKTEHARRALEKEVLSRPVIYSRAPSWHKFNVLAGRPKLIDGDTITINSLVTTGLNADFDGDRNLSYVYLLLSNDYLGSMTDEQANKIIIIGEKTECNILQKDVALHATCCNTGAPMKNKINIPVYNKDTHTLCLVDLEDFPHGELIKKSSNATSDISVYMPENGTQVVVYDEATGTTKWADVACWSLHEGTETEIVDLHNGAQIITDDDPRAVYGIPSDSLDLAMERTSPGESLARSFVVPYSEKLKSLINQPDRIINEVDFQDFPGTGKMPLNWETGYLMGAFAGDGWWNKTTCLALELKGSYFNWGTYIADLKGHNASKVKEILINYFGESEIKYSTKEYNRTADNGRYGDTVKHCFYSLKYGEALCKFFSTHLGGERGENHTGSGSKKLPSFAYTAPESFRRGMLCGLMDTDGSVSISNAKGKPQLLTAFSSTSSRLIRDVKLLCGTLNLRSTIVFSKVTDKGNNSWILSISAVDAKKQNIFNSLQCPWKRDNFINTSVDDKSEASAAQDLVPMPACVLDILASEIGTPRITEEDSGSALERKRKQASVAAILSKARKLNTVSRISATNMISLIQELVSARMAHNERAIKWLKSNNVLNKTAVREEEIQMLREAILNAAPKYSDVVLYEQGKKMYANLNRPLKEGGIALSTINKVLGFLENNKVFTKTDTSVFIKWLIFVRNVDVSWTRVTGVQKTGIKEDGYDLTVPGYETFMSVDGIILSNTLNLHVPSQDEAVKEAYDKLMPSKMLFSIKNQDQVVPVPKQELVLGLFTANKRPAKAMHSFNTEAEALRAIRAGDVNLSDEIEIKGAGDKYNPLQ